ncbi:hypothetical protein BGP78_20365 [Pseudoalteromonas sp. MSK9-3]|nr:hypothetical protein BGP78_20365 [Pseudoalteromonas sp. MSK9-3]
MFLVLKNIFKIIVLTLINGKTNNIVTVHNLLIKRLHNNWHANQGSNELTPDEVYFGKQETVL